MITHIDERNGTVKTCWANIRERVAQVEPTFARIVDTLSPDDSYAVYLAYYPYGALEGDTESTFLPTMNSDFFRLCDSTTPPEIANDLGYGKDSSPFGMVLEKQLELFIDNRQDRITIPWLTYTPGKMFPFSRLLSRKQTRVYAPNGLLSSTAGARSVFLVPNIGCATHHVNLQRDFNVRSSPPKALYEHWSIFKEIMQSCVIESDWRCCILYFAQKWIDNIIYDKDWVDLKHYLHELAWQQYEYERNRIFYDIALSQIKKKRNLKPNPYLADTARHLFTIAIGAAPGYAPAVNDDALPISTIQEAYTHSYGLKKYHPTIMQPSNFVIENNPAPVYYSLQNPSTHVFSPKSREISSTLTELRELHHMMNIFTEELSATQSICSDTILGDVAKKVRFGYYHNKKDNHNLIASSNDIAARDQRYLHMGNGKFANQSTFAADSPFMRGCIKIEKW